MLVIAHIDCASWLRRVVTWDGLLPVVISLVPSVIEFLFPNGRGAIEITAVVLPIAGVLLRFQAGMHHISSNRCSSLVRGVQVAVFMVGILPLVLFDCFMILSHVMPAGGPMPAEDVIGWSLLLTIYFGAMVIAMYPGRLIDNPYRAPLELAWQPPWRFFALLILCVICGVWAAALPRHEPARYLTAICSFASGAHALGILVASVRTQAFSLQFNNHRFD